MGRQFCHKITKLAFVMSFHEHVQRVAGNIPDLDLPADFDCTETTDLIITTDGSLLS
jgi:hypothetical protein